MTQTALEQATASLDRALARAQVSVRPVTCTDELVAMEALLARVWQHPPGVVEIDVTMLARAGPVGQLCRRRVPR